MERETKDEWNLFTFNTHFISSQQSFPLSFLLIFLWLIPEGSSFPFLHTIPSNLFLGVIFKGMWWIVYPFLTLQNMPIIELNETEINHENPFLCCRTPEFRWKKTGGGWREKWMPFRSSFFTQFYLYGWWKKRRRTRNRIRMKKEV